MIITVYRSVDEDEEFVSFVGDFERSDELDVIVNGVQYHQLEAHQVNYDGDIPELEELLLDKVFTRTRTKEEEYDA